MTRLLAITALVSSLATAALAGPAPVTATLAAPLAKPTTVVAAGAAWRCADTACKLASDSTVETYAACRAIAKQVGAVAEIGAPGKLLDADRLAKCNSK